jgi:hypothetical protein
VELETVAAADGAGIQPPKAAAIAEIRSTPSHRRLAFLGGAP